MKPVRVLAINGGPLDYGGISMHMLSYLKHMDPALVRVDIAVHGALPGPREAEAERLGAKIFHLPNKREDYRGNVEGMKKLFASGEYPIVHSHLDGMNGFSLGLAKSAGVKNRISHCHNTGYLTTNPARVLLHTLEKRRIPSVCTQLLACSENAGRFFYGDRIVNAGKLRVVKNALELSRYRFDEGDRERLRRELALPERAFVIGHVGRFEPQKNHAFLLRAFAARLRLRPDAILVLCGDGVLRAEIERRAEQLGVADSLRILGYRPDVNRLLSAFDLFVLPSLFEGLGIALIEAQLSGLPCLAADTVPPDTDIVNCAYLPLREELWAERMLCAPNMERNVPLEPFIEAGYDIVTEAKKMEAFYRSLA